MEHIYTIEGSENNGSQVIKMSIAYWNKHGNNFLINKETFDKEMIEFLKNVEDIHARIESPYEIVVQTPLMRVPHRHIFHKYTRMNEIYFNSIGDPVNFENFRPMRIHLIKKPVIPKIEDDPEVKESKRILDDDTKKYIEQIKMNMIKYIETIFDNTMKEHFQM